MATKSIYTYEVTFINKDNIQTYDHVRAESYKQAVLRVLTWPDVREIVGKPARIK